MTSPPPFAIVLPKSRGVGLVQILNFEDGVFERLVYECRWISAIDAGFPRLKKLLMHCEWLETLV
jgi:hypothetical protein